MIAPEPTKKQKAEPKVESKPKQDPDQVKEAKVEEQAGEFVLREVLGAKPIKDENN